MTDHVVESSSGPRVSVTAVTAHPEEIQHVRRLANERLRHWGHAKEVRQVVAQGISELLTNVHKHVGHGAPCTLTLAERPEGLVVMVHDTSPRMAVPAEAAWDSETGRGLSLLQAMVAELRSEPTPTGKVVSFLVTHRTPDAADDAWAAGPASDHGPR
ncbi:ATP-binding protein [Streptomyces sp. LX-29]|uniref:ATP-binding protein n=1 Tax=Streptomyces sp. LX-29 TaxID=2900152 RepID=UPI00240D3BDE|nr:ATP-binding protein [Streptomyces sp. LX-29]WFB09657.1 ATP-binding protein [Streptomyces sp. LX-29]